MKREVWFAIVCFLGYAWAADRFCKSCLEITKKKEILFVLLLWGGCLAAQAILPAAFPMLVQVILPVVLTILLFQGVWEKKILAASVVLTVITLAGNFCGSSMCCLLLVWLHMVKGIQEPFLTGGMSSAAECVSFAIVIALLCGMAESSTDVFAGKDRRWYITMAIPLLILTAVMSLVNWGVGNGVLVRTAEEVSLYYDQIFSHLYIIILCALSLFGAVSFAAGMNRICLEQRKSGQYQAQIAAYKMLEEQYEQAERLRHDMKNHLIALGGLLEEQEFQKMHAYLEKMKESGSLESGKELTGNRVVDALLYEKRKWAEREGIAWKCDVHLPKVCGIDEFDLCVLFGNILDNAIEACEKLERGRQRFIDIQAEMVRGCFLLEVKNSTDTAKIQGIKTKEKGHGIGLLNIGDMVKRYQGVMNREEGEEIYTISILLPFEKGGDDSVGKKKGKGGLL